MAISPWPANAARSLSLFLTLVDDTEKSGLHGRDLYQRQKFLAQRLPAGESKAISKHAQKQDLPHLRWTTIGMASGPVASTTLAESSGTPLDGQVVRFFNLAVPSEGILAFGDYAGPENASSRAKLMRQIETGLATNHGVLMEVWIEHLLKEDRSPAIEERVDSFVRKHADPKNPITIRIAKKIGLLYAAGRIAQQAGLLPWPDKWPRQVARFVYEEIIHSISTADGGTKNLIEKLRNAILDPACFVERMSKSGYVFFGKDAVGLCIHTGAKPRRLIQLDRLTNLGVPAAQCRSAGDQLLQLGIIKRSKNASGTVQERVKDESGSVRKLRLWILDADKLTAAR
jgi:hypothetical protein